jgi:hypothetical protein
VGGPRRTRGCVDAYLCWLQVLLLTRPAQAEPAGNIEGKWTHDLFEAGSDIYHPRLNIAPEPYKPSPSLRPFGELTPSSAAPPPTAARPLLSDSAPPVAPAAMRPPSQPRAPKGDLISRVQIRGAANGGSGALAASAAQNLPVPTQPRVMLAQPPQLAQTPRGRPVLAARSPSEMRELKDAEDKARREFNEALRAYSEGPVHVQVTNLADGTSEDDVRVGHLVSLSHRSSSLNTLRSTDGFCRLWGDPVL